MLKRSVNERIQSVSRLFEKQVRTSGVTASVSDVCRVTYVPSATADVVASDTHLIQSENTSGGTWRLVLALKRCLVTGGKFLCGAEVVTSRRKKSSNRGF